MSSLNVRINGNHVVVLNQEQTKVLHSWLLNFHNGWQDPIFKLANSMIANVPMDNNLMLEAAHALEQQHAHTQRMYAGTNKWMGARQLAIANALAGMCLGIDPTTVIGKTVEFMQEYENKM